MFELPKTIPAVKMLLAPEELGSTILFLLKKWIFRTMPKDIQSVLRTLQVVAVGRIGASTLTAINSNMRVLSKEISLRFEDCK